MSKEDSAPKNVTLRCNEEFSIASEISWDREEGVKKFGVSSNPVSDKINFEVKLRQSSTINERSYPTSPGYLKP